MRTDFDQVTEHRTKKASSIQKVKMKSPSIEELPDGIYCNFSFNNRAKPKFETIILKEKMKVN